MKPKLPAKLRRRRRRRGPAALVEGVLHNVLAATEIARRLIRGWRTAR